MKNMRIQIGEVSRVEISKWSSESNNENHYVEIKVFSEGEEFLLELESSGMNGPQIAFMDKD